MPLPHLDCTTEQRRLLLCQEYTIHVDDCIPLYGGHTVRSDANNRIIRDHYYQFSCQHNIRRDMYVILCGENAARHLCSIIGEPLPSVFNPYLSEGRVEHGGGNNNIQVEWNHDRRCFYYAVRLFIMRYQNALTPGTKIFRLLKSIEGSHQNTPPQRFHFEDFSSIVDGFHTNIPLIVQELAQFGNIRNFNFANLELYMSKEMNIPDNIFSINHSQAH